MASYRPLDQSHDSKAYTNTTEYLPKTVWRHKLDKISKKQEKRTKEEISNFYMRINLIMLIFRLSKLFILSKHNNNYHKTKIYQGCFESED